MTEFHSCQFIMSQNHMNSFGKVLYRRKRSQHYHTLICMCLEGTYSNTFGILFETKSDEKCSSCVVLFALSETMGFTFVITSKVTSVCVIKKLFIILNVHISTQDCEGNQYLSQRLWNRWKHVPCASCFGCLPSAHLVLFQINQLPPSPSLPLSLSLSLSPSLSPSPPPLSLCISVSISLTHHLLLKQHI